MQGRRGDGPARLFCISVALALLMRMLVAVTPLCRFSDVPLSFSIPIPNKEIA
ncbi:hypothetical protein BSU04_05395 [Caballeronia sordidicola]|uniref:Uncharacterized protein n=1 Tax=Caballeronia sordidicola TaxID=196367 RepID=A0A226X879_CABSO|nr:hypothetical protein BSU04_05395 [Caballeronia sordidicola]